MTPLFKKFLGFNWLFFINTLALLAMGVLAIYSASYFREKEALKVLWSKQINWIGIGAIGYFVVALIDYKWIKWGALFIYLEIGRAHV